VDERADYDIPVAKVKASGIYYPGTGNLDSVTPYFSEAPGLLVKPFGREIGSSRFILINQAELNERCGYMLAKENQRWHIVRMKFLNDGSFITVPQEVFPATIEATDNNRGLSWTPDLIPRRVRRNYDHKLGLLETEVEFVPSSTGPPGVTISLPSEPPEGTFIPPDPVWPPDDVAMLIWSPDFGLYYRGLGGEDWEDRNTGLSGSDLVDTWGGGDPWWWTSVKQDTYDPEFVILFTCSGNGIWRTDDGGRVDWQDITPGTGVTASMDFVGHTPDGFTNKVHYFVGRELLGGATGTSRLCKTDDDGATWTVVEIT
jgi:hypothetical protein